MMRRTAKQMKLQLAPVAEGGASAAAASAAVPAAAAGAGASAAIPAALVHPVQIRQQLVRWPVLTPSHI